MDAVMNYRIHVSVVSDVAVIWFQTWLLFRKIKLCDDAVVFFVYVVQDLRIAEAFLEGGRERADRGWFQKTVDDPDFHLLE